MGIKKILVPSIGALITGVLLLKSNSKTALKFVDVTAKAAKEAEVTFGGVPLSKLNELAKNIYHGVKVTIDEYGFLVFHFKSNSGKTMFRPQIKINELGKLVSHGGYYPGQWWSAADEFVKRANELFSFKK